MVPQASDESIPFFSKMTRVFKRILHREQNFDILDKESGKYYIGKAIRGKNPVHTHFRLSIAMSLPTFYEFSIENVINYFMAFEPRVLIQSYMIPAGIQIMQLVIIDAYPDNPRLKGLYEMYTVLLKTHWLRLVQRRWRVVLLARRAFMMSPHSLYYREIYGRYPKNPHTLMGMLAGLGYLSKDIK